MFVDPEVNFSGLQDSFFFCQDDKSLSSQLSVEHPMSEVLQRGESHNSINSISSQDSKEHKIPRTSALSFLNGFPRGTASRPEAERLLSLSRAS